MDTNRKPLPTRNNRNSCRLFVLCLLFDFLIVSSFAECPTAPVMMPANSRASKSRKRPQSRASTASNHSSVSTQPNLDQGFTDASQVYAGQWIANDHAQPKDAAVGSQQMTTEEALILQAASRMQANRDFSVDPSVSASLEHGMSFHQHPNMGRHSLPAESFSASHSFADPDSQMMDRDGNEDVDSGAALPGVSKSSRTSANNELEMRQLFQANKARTLQDVAEELHGNERGPNSERTRQIFAMLW